mmetsp:Transcript_124330/g.363055  ORF Transcript_124330/g.363055 Transcript_124330/m.363055 type:complete len:380 (-) Transcript_124330:359-1498(-)
MGINCALGRLGCYRFVLVGRKCLIMLLSLLWLGLHPLLLLPLGLCILRILRLPLRVFPQLRLCRLLCLQPWLRNLLLLRLRLRNCLIQRLWLCGVLSLQLRLHCLIIKRLHNLLRWHLAQGQLSCQVVHGRQHGQRGASLIHGRHHEGTYQSGLVSAFALWGSEQELQEDVTGVLCERRLALRHFDLDNIAHAIAAVRESLVRCKVQRPTRDLQHLGDVSLHSITKRLDIGRRIEDDVRQGRWVHERRGNALFIVTRHHLDRCEHGRSFAQLLVDGHLQDLTSACNLGDLVVCNLHFHDIVEACNNLLAIAEGLEGAEANVPALLLQHAGYMDLQPVDELLHLTIRILELIDCAGKRQVIEPLELPGPIHEWRAVDGEG